MYWNVKIDILEVYMDVTHFPVWREVLILSGVFILNFSVFRNLIRVLRFKIDLNLLLGLGTKKCRLKKPRDFLFLTSSTVCFCTSACNACQVADPERMCIATYDGL